MPLIEPQNKQEKVLKKLPPGGLHVLILGAGNELYDSIEENIPKGKKTSCLSLKKLLDAKDHLIMAGNGKVIKYIKF